MIGLKVEKALTSLARELDRASSPVLCFSGGKDSTLLLEMVIKLKADISLLVFQDLWSPEYRKYVKTVIADKGMRAFFYPPVAVDTLDDGRVIAPVYRVGEGLLPVVMQVEGGDRCGAKMKDRVVSKMSVEPQPPYIFDLTITGSKACDEYYAVKNLDPRSLSTSRFRIECPLWKWTDSEVLQGLVYLDAVPNPDVYGPEGKRPKTDDGAFMACLDCYQISKEEVFCPAVQANIPTVLNAKKHTQ